MPATTPTCWVGVTSRFYVEPTSQGAVTPSTRTPPATSATTCPPPAGPAHAPRRVRRVGRTPRCPVRRAARRRSSTRSSGSTQCSATTGSSPRSASADSPSMPPPAPSSCSPPKSSRRSDARRWRTRGSRSPDGSQRRQSGKSDLLEEGAVVVEEVLLDDSAVPRLRHGGELHIDDLPVGSTELPSGCLRGAVNVPVNRVTKQVMSPSPNRTS